MIRGFGNQRGAGRLAIGAVLLAAACGGGAPAERPEAGPAGGAELTAFQLEHGIGPVTAPVTLGPPDAGMVGVGQTVFEQKCSACHKLGEKYVGPALGDVTTRRSPAFIINMIMNPQEMIERHPVVQQLVAEHMSFMPYQDVTLDEARQVLEYLRAQTTRAR